MSKRVLKISSDPSTRNHRRSFSLVRLKRNVGKLSSDPHARSTYGEYRCGSLEFFIFVTLGHRGSLEFSRTPSVTRNFYDFFRSPSSVSLGVLANVSEPRRGVVWKFGRRGGGAGTLCGPEIARITEGLDGHVPIY